jgi:hypothetical protein
MKLVLIDPKKYLKVELKLFNRYRQNNRYRYKIILTTLPIWEPPIDLTPALRYPICTG